ncbi:MAG: FHA domain-containing protein [Chloroflexi bacterium]|nr:MAG: FHA domain-containing protein [Chloroflexota bacterium]
MNPDDPTLNRDEVDLDTHRLTLAKITWQDPTSGDIHEFVLTEGATATIGRLKSNDICIPEEHVSRQHSVINYRDGIFVISDLGSSNGTFVNDEPITDEFPLASGDQIRLFVPILIFSSTVTEEDHRQAEEHGTLITATANTGGGKIIISNGPQEGNIIPLLLKKVTIGRATTNAQWEIALQDPSVSRPHARMQLVDDTWVVYDLGSANGTFVNGTQVHERGRALRDGDTIKFGQTLVLFRAG